MEIKNNIDGYTFIWEDKNLSIRVSRLVVHKDGRVTGEIVIERGGRILMPATQFNFSAERTRISLIKNLNQKFKNIDWFTIIDELSHNVQELSRQGESFRELWTSEDAPPPEYLLKPILFKNMPTVVFGEKGVRKSGLSIVFATCLLLPWYDNPLGFITPEKSTRTLILDWETEFDIVHYEAKRLKDGMGIPDFPIYYRRCNLPLSDDLGQIQEQIESAKAEVIIIDSLGAAAGGELNKPEIALNFFSALRKLKRTSLIIAQTSKSEEGKKSIYGSTYFTYYSRSIFELCRAEESGDELHTALFHKWCNVDKTQPPIGLCFQFNGTAVRIEREPVNYTEFKNKLSVKNQIKDLLSRGKMQTKEIADELGVSEASVRVALNRNKNLFQHFKDGWGLIVIEN